MREIKRAWRSAPHPQKRWQQLLSAAILIALWGVVVLGLNPVFALDEWALAAWALAAVPLAIGALLRLSSRVAPRYAAAAGVIAACAMWIAWFVGAGRLKVWWEEPAMAWQNLQSRVITGVAPMRLDGVLEDAVSLVVLLISIVLVVIAIGLRRSLLAGVVIALLLLIPIVVAGYATTVPVLVAAGILLALLAWTGSPKPRPIGLVSAGAAIAVAAATLMIAPTSRDRVWNSAVLFAPVSITVPDVTVTLAQDLRQRSETIAFTAMGTYPGSQRFPLATLVDFEDGVWKPQFELNNEGHDVNMPRWVWGLEPEVNLDGDLGYDPWSGSNVTINIEGLRSTWLPVLQSTVAIQGTNDFDDSAWAWVQGSPTARSETGITRNGDRYRVAASPTRLEDILAALDGESAMNILAQLSPGFYEMTDGVPRAVEQHPLLPAIAPEDVAPYLSLPDRVPAVLSETAQSVAGDAETALMAAIALQQYFLLAGFSYDESAPYSPGADPDDPYAVMTALLEQRRGFCVHYASTFAVMARELGMPTRMVVGYAARQASNDHGVEVRGTDLHAWPEVFIQEMGWIAFEPTPGGAGFRADRNIDVPAEPEVEPREQERPTPTVSPDASPFERPEAALEKSDDVGAEEGGVIPAAVWWIGAGALCVLLLAAPAFLRAVRARVRTNRITARTLAAQHGWSEIEDLTVDLGLVASAAPLRAQTPGALVEHLETLGLSEEAVRSAHALAEGMEAERYGAEQPSDADTGADAQNVTEHLELVRTQLMQLAPRRARIVARLLPRSLLSSPHTHAASPR